MPSSIKKYKEKLKKDVKKTEKTLKYNKKVYLSVLLVICILGLLLCFKIGKVHENDTDYIVNVDYESIPNNMESDFPYLYLNENDLDETGLNIIKVNLDEYFEEEYLIDKGGTYEISGELEGRLYIDAKDDNVHLLLNNVDIKAIDGPAIIVKDAVSVVITMMEDSVNKISDSGDYRNSPDYEACIQVYSNLTFNGTGSLEVSGLFKDGIRSRDTVKVVDGYISIECKRSAIHGTDGINIAGGELFVASEKNGFKTTKNGINNRGVLMVSGGNITIIAGRYAFVSEAPVYVYNCSIYNNSVATYSATTIYEQKGCIYE